ncbi:hypothetical protein HHI36_005372 [Cryptolaemus montrouzieri]|uniref:Uncharacterized protein n=1 Tax=Cryptolaemus montrouzieri TaxID=559131 RepID=A0ABD2NU09_9CUCU
MKAEVQLRMDMNTLKEKAISSEISAEVRSRSNNIIMMVVQDETEVSKVIQFLEVGVTEVDIKLKTIHSSRPLKPFIVSFADDKFKKPNTKATERKLDQDSFKNLDLKEMVAEQMEQKMENLLNTQESNEGINVEELWDKFQTIVKDVTRSA